MHYYYIVIPSFFNQIEKSVEGFGVDLSYI